MKQAKKRRAGCFASIGRVYSLPIFLQAHILSLENKDFFYYKQRIVERNIHSNGKSIFKPLHTGIQSLR